jgi:predicted Co/Zn/Cd cation transporter (cation efflux family)
MKYLVLSRPHDINNKDRLQYIQVKTENLINSLSHTVTYKHAKSTSIAISSCVFAVCFLILGLVFTFAVNAAYSLPIYIISYALAFVCVLGIILPLAIFRKREERVAQEKIKEHLKKIENLMAQVKKIFADDENQKITLKGEENFINADNNYDDVYDVEAEGGKR